MIVTLSRKFSFSAAHRLHNKHWTQVKNAAIFGKCNNPNYHGHNYELIVKLIGSVDPATGYVMDIKVLKDIVESAVIERFDHRNLNLDINEFKELNPTAENIAYIIYQLIRPLIDKDKKLVIVLYETERNSVEYHGE